MIGYPRVIRLKGKEGGKTLLITAGMDGDEYAGISAAYRLIEEFSHTPFRGSITIVPIVNMPGFVAQTSENPEDGKFPKCIFPGKKNGTPTEQLCWWVSDLARVSDFWLDMHGGALTEILNPFVGSWVSGNKVIDELIIKVISSISCKYASFENMPAVSKTKLLAKMGCGYLLAESGELGKCERQDVDRHIGWAREVMGALEMLDQKMSDHKKVVFDKVCEYSIRHDGLWYANYSVCREMKKGELLGEVKSQTEKILERITVKENGMLLWAKVGLSVRRGDVVAGVGYA